MNDENKYQMVAVKRKWVPEWFFAIFAWPIDFIVHQPFRWIFTKPVKVPKTITGLLAEARNSLDYHIEWCFLAETPEQEEEAAAAMKKFIKDNYIPRNK